MDTMQLWVSTALVLIYSLEMLDGLRKSAYGLGSDWFSWKGIVFPIYAIGLIMAHVYIYIHIWT